jgi:hypothetical protein
MRKNKISKSYIAGFFDGEGSAMALTHRVKEKIGYHYRIRPVIKIVQKTKPILMEIKEHLGYGTVVLNYVKSGECWTYQLNGQKNILRFIKTVEPYCRLKNRQLKLIEKMISFQIKKNQPYERELFEKIINTRDEIFIANKNTRSGIKQHHPKDKILKEHVFINIEEFELLRRLKRNAKN